MIPGPKPRLTEDQVRGIRDYLARWRAIPRPSEVARKNGISVSRLYQIGDAREYKWVRFTDSAETPRGKS